MAVIRLSELKQMSSEALQAKLAELEAEIAREKGLVKSTSKPANAGKYKETRKVRARIKTLLGQRGVRV
ncbi:MAG: 50S ribosomal protein L29 [Candidatus Micrarchaeota archaeon]